MNENKRVRFLIDDSKKSANFRFPNANNACMYDGKGNLVKCKCGKLAGCGIMGKEAFISMCTTCFSQNNNTANFIYRPPNSVLPIAQDAMPSVKFAQNVRILDDWWLFGGTRWSRTVFRLRHPIVYSKRGLRNLYRRIKRIFVKPKMIQPLARHPHDKSST